MVFLQIWKENASVTGRNVGKRCYKFHVERLGEVPSKQDGIGLV